MTDTRFTTAFDELDNMLSAVDVDEVGGIETMLMFLFARPIAVDEVWDTESKQAALEVVVAGNDLSVGSTYDFPLSVMELARACAETVEELGPYVRDDVAAHDESPDVSGMGDAELIAALQQALG